MKRARQIQQANRQKRYERWQQMRELTKTGASDRELGRQLNLDHCTVKKFRNAEIYPEAVPRVRQSIVDDYATYLAQRLGEGCRSSTRLWRELREQGFRRQVNSARDWLRQRRCCQSRGFRTRAPATRSARFASSDRLVHAQSHALCAGAITTGLSRSTCDRETGTGLFRIFRERGFLALILWITEAKETALTGFATRLERDLDAVQAALTLPWSQGHVEGQVH